MFCERILEEKKKLNLTAKSMSAMSELHTTEETIGRILNKRTLDPGINTVVDIAKTVGLQPYELFMSSTLAAEFKVFLQLRDTNEQTEAERISMIAENDTLKTTNVSLSQKIETLETKIEHLQALLLAKEELLTLYRQIHQSFDFKTLQ